MVQVLKEEWGDAHVASGAGQKESCRCHCGGVIQHIGLGWIESQEIERERCW